MRMKNSEQAPNKEPDGNAEPQLETWLKIHWASPPNGGAIRKLLSSWVGMCSVEATQAAVYVSRGHCTLMELHKPDQILQWLVVFLTKVILVCLEICNVKLEITSNLFYYLLDGNLLDQCSDPSQSAPRTPRVPGLPSQGFLSFFQAHFLARRLQHH